MWSESRVRYWQGPEFVDLTFRKILLVVLQLQMLMEDQVVVYYVTKAHLGMSRR